MYHYTIVKPIEFITPRMNSNVNYGLCIIMMCQCRFILCNKCPIWWECGGRGGWECMWTKVVYGKRLYLPLNFAVNLKLL